jgi:hypothetical protein
MPDALATSRFCARTDRGGEMFFVAHAVLDVIGERLYPTPMRNDIGDVQVTSSIESGSTRSV